jgi:hypothetical protein
LGHFAGEKGVGMCASDWGIFGLFGDLDAVWLRLGLAFLELVRLKDAQENIVGFLRG